MRFPKPPAGSAAKAKRTRRSAITRAEIVAKREAKQRDHFTCRCCGGAMVQGSLLRQVEAAHLAGKGMGGDHGLRSSEPRCYVTLCLRCHQGPRSVHSGHVVAVFGPDGGDGVVTFESRRDVTGNGPSL